MEPAGTESDPVGTTQENTLPKVQKKQQERIHSSIQHLRSLFYQTTQLPVGQDIELEDADILEMAVSLLRQKACSSYMRGFSQCLQETLRHVSLHAHLQPRDTEAIKRFYVHQRTSLRMGSMLPKHGRRRSTSSKRSRNGVALWRPWKHN